MIVVDVALVCAAAKLGPNRVHYCFCLVFYLACLYAVLHWSQIAGNTGTVRYGLDADKRETDCVTNMREPPASIYRPLYYLVLWNYVHVEWAAKKNTHDQYLGGHSLLNWSSINCLLGLESWWWRFTRLLDSTFPRIGVMGQGVKIRV